MKLTPETKHALILGGGLIAAVVLGIIVYKNFEANSQAGQAASDQASQDELAYLESLSLGGAYSGYSAGDGGSAITIPSAPATQSLADEISQIEQAFGFGSSSPSTSTSSSSSQNAGAAAALATHNLESGSSPSGIHAAAVPGFGGSKSGSPVLEGQSVYSVLDEPVGKEGSYVA